ncbi:17053_t:CDS:2, partial [Funneliformis geosporum]
ADDNEIYGIIPFVASEVFREEYTKASDVKKAFWNRVHDVDLIIDICDGLRPPI